jgi:hypothetical protein
MDGTRLGGLLLILPGVEKHKQNDAFREWSRCVFHEILRYVLASIQAHMQNGIRMRYADRQIRLCFPTLSQYIADMEEQWLLGCLVKGSCPKCLAPRQDLEHQGKARHDNPLWRSNPECTDEHAATYRTCDESHDASRLCDKEHLAFLRSLGYHPTQPFSASYPCSGIINAIGPDLLHQVSKCFKDYILDKWIVPLVVWNGERQGQKKGIVLWELDRRFITMAGYQNMRRFSNGVFTQNHHWTVHEHKQMMKVILGVLQGICPMDGIDLVREYIHIHQLCHYAAHTERTMGYLNSAIDTLWSVLKDPERLFVKLGLIPSQEYAPPRLHYLSHYVQSIQQFGVLPGYST